MPALPTRETGSSSWPTPDVPNGGRTLSPEAIAAKGATEKGKRQVGLENAAKMWPTLAASLPQDGEEPETFFARAQAIKAKGINGNGAGTPLAIAAKQWATPRSSDWRSGEVSDEIFDRNSRHSLPDQKTPQDGEPTLKRGRVLNPQFVEALQGWPIGWSACGSSATESSPSKQPSPCDFSTPDFAEVGS